MLNDRQLSDTMQQSFEKLHIPNFDAQAIHARADQLQREQTAGVQPRRRRGLAIGLLFLAPAMALAYSNRESLEKAITARIHAEQGQIVPITFSYPAAITLAKAQATAPYHLVMPQGLPAGYKLSSLYGDSSGKYNAHYANGRRGVNVEIQKYNPHVYHIGASVRFTDDGKGHMKEIRVHSRAFVVGDELMLLSSNDLTDAQFAQIKRALGATDEPLPAKGAMTVTH